jgi:DNA-binding NtrC family response regulator
MRNETAENGLQEPPLQETRTFLVVRLGSDSWVIDVPPGEELTVGRDADSGVRIDSGDVAPVQATLHWDGLRVTLTHHGPGSTFLNGKRLEGSAELKPGDEISVGPAQLVIGVAGPLTTGGRRALTHHEFRERLYEEMARAARGGRPTTLVMVQTRPGEGGHVAATALDSFRAGDVVGTYAHDELEFLFPDTPGDTARPVVERVLRNAGTQIVAGIAVARTDADSPERLMRAARRALEQARKQGGGISTPPEHSSHQSIEPTVQDPTTIDLIAELERLAQTDTPVLLTGEVSSGKGLFARLLHDRGPRADGPFVVIPCASLASEQDAEGAFGTEGAPDPSSATRARGGTLLLDEVGDLPPEGQKHLRSLLQREAQGSSPSFRVVATTHRALGGLVERGAFDSELYDALRGEVLEVPPLRNRPEDIIPLARSFAEELGARQPVRMTAGALARLRSYPWPGNVLELRNAMERAVRLASGGEILAEHLPAETLPFAPNEGRLREHVDGVERDAIIKALADSNHNQTHAARRLGVSRRALIYKMEKYGLKPPPGSGRKSA